MGLVLWKNLRKQPNKKIKKCVVGPQNSFRKHEKRKERKKKTLRNRKPF